MGWMDGWAPPNPPLPSAGRKLNLFGDFFSSLYSCFLHIWWYSVPLDLAQRLAMITC
jgi:hypothetical protein